MDSGLKPCFRRPAHTQALLRPAGGPAPAGEGTLVVVLGVNERDHGSVYNAQLIFDETGALRLKRRKLTPTFHERMVWGQGDGAGLKVVDTAVGRVGALACWGAVALAGPWVQARFGDRLASLNAGIAKEGGFYLFTLRLVPVVPFFVINLAMGLTPMRTWTFYWVSQLGMLAGTAVYVNAGTQLGQLTSLQGILSPGLVGSFVLLGLFPLIARRVVEAVQRRKVYAKWASVRPATPPRSPNMASKRRLQRTKWSPRR